MENVWSRIFCPEVLDTMRLLGCDERYINGEASDFECLAQWLSALPIMSGNTVAEKTVRLICELLCIDDISELCACDIWQKYNDFYYGEISGFCVEKSNDVFFEYNDVFFKYKSIKCDEKENDFLNIRDIGSFADGTLSSFDEICNFIEKSSDNKISATLYGNAFLRPNRYSAQLALNNILCDEKCNFVENNILNSQIICEYAYKCKNGFLQLYLYPQNGIGAAVELIKYLVARELRVRVHLCVMHDTVADEVRSACLCSGKNCFVTPLLLPCDGEDAQAFRTRLSRIYPIGLLESLG